jgi:hypothetical protein
MKKLFIVGILLLVGACTSTESSPMSSYMYMPCDCSLEVQPPIHHHHGGEYHVHPYQDTMREQTVKCMCQAEEHSH